MFSNQFKLFDFEVSRNETNLSIFKPFEFSLTNNMVFYFVITAYNYAKIVFKPYSSVYSGKKYTQPQLFAIITYKMYNKFDYRKTIENLELSTKLTEALDLKTIPHYTTLQKFFKRLKTSEINTINKLILDKFNVEDCSFILDGTGFTSSYSDVYYNSITKKNTIKIYQRSHNNRFKKHGRISK